MNPRRRRHNKRARRRRDVFRRAVRYSQEYMMYLLTRVTPKIEVTSPVGYTRHIQATITFER